MSTPKHASKSLLTALAVVSFILLLPAQLPAQTWELVWSDEFDGPSIDLTKWSFEVNGQGGGNNELQYYTDRTENAQIINGVLHIIGRAETYTGPDGTRNYTSARLRTVNKGDWTYGRFEASIKLPYGQGMWPAFWMLPSDWVYGGWPQSGEIDIMENVGYEPDLTHGTIHYGDPWPNNSWQGNSVNVPNSSTQFHTYAVEWEENVIRWYLDGALFSTKTPADTNPKPWPFDQRFHILLNLAIGGNWPGSPDGSTVFPQHFEIDYVRVYQRAVVSYQDKTIYENYDGTSVFSPAYMSGTYTAPVANPAPNSVNSSANAAQYIRDGAAAWDTLFLDTTAINATAFEASDEFFALDVYTSAPAGTSIIWQLEDSSTATSSNFPTGRRSRFVGTVGQQNAWHTVRFSFDQVLDGLTAANAVDNVVLLFDGGNYTSYTFTIDNLRSQEVGTGNPPTPVLTTMTVSPDPGSVEEGQTLQFSVSCLDQFNNAIACNPSWSTSGGGTINGSGLYSATTAGSFTVTATDGSTSDSAAVDVTAAPSTTLLSQGKPASSSSNENASLTPNLAVDGNAGTRWASGWSDNEWIYVDLEATATVSRVVLNWEDAYATQYQVQVSNNASNWTTVYTENNGNGGIDDVTFTAVAARYVRVLGIARALPYGYSLWELEVHGEAGAPAASNVALGKPASSSSNENASLTPNLAFDGDGATRWASAFSDPQWIRVDLQATYNISSVKLVWEAAASANYQIQVSNNGSSWTTVYTDTNGNGGTDEIALSASGRYVRMYSTARTTQWGNSLWEFEVWGTP